ncbi:MAG: Bax inhibitor-1/YccA family protein [Terriglobia bacterium]|nr:Bax inhibitor-1/YccA family protein [Terriglobia bacterium]
MSTSGSFLPEHTRSTVDGTVYDPTAPAQTPDLDTEEVEQSQRGLLVRVYAFMFAGLMLSALVAFWAASHTEIGAYTLRHPEGFQIVFFSEIIAVGFISRYVGNLSIPAAWALFAAYAILNGVSFSVFFLYFPPTAVMYGFLLTGMMFGAMALYGHVSGCDLGSGWNILLMGVFGFVLQILVNAVLGHTDAYYASATLGIIVFCGLASYHAGNIRDFEWEFDDDDSLQDKAAVVGALLLYLDFVNLYMMIMRAVAVLERERENEEGPSGNSTQI